MAGSRMSGNEEELLEEGTERDGNLNSFLRCV